MEAHNPETASTKTTKTRDFPSPPLDGFGFIGRQYETPDRTRPIPSGAGLAHFEACLHWGSPKWRFSEWKEMPITAQPESVANVKDYRFLEMGVIGDGIPPNCRYHVFTVSAEVSISKK